MSIHNDDRQYGSEEERAEWKQELKAEYRKQEYEDDKYAYDERDNQGIESIT